MTAVDELLRYDGKHVVVTGCASGIGAAAARQLAVLGARVTGLDLQAPAEPVDLTDFVEIDLSDGDSIDAATGRLDARVDALFNVAGVSSGIGNPLLVVRINFLGTRALTEAILPRMATGATITNVSSLAAASYRENAHRTAGLLDTLSMADGVAWCRAHPETIADGGYRLSKEAIILYGIRRVAELGARGIRINATAPGVTETPILDQLRSAYGQGYLDSFTTPLGRVATAEEQAAVLVYLGSGAASYITGQVIWVDGGTIAQRANEES